MTGVIVTGNGTSNDVRGSSAAMKLTDGLNATTVSDQAIIGRGTGLLVGQRTGFPAAPLCRLLPLLLCTLVLAYPTDFRIIHPRSRPGSHPEGTLVAIHSV